MEKIMGWKRIPPALLKFKCWAGQPGLAWVVINSVLGSQCAIQAHFLKTGRGEQQSGKFLFGREVAEDRATTGPEQQGAEAQAGVEQAYAGGVVVCARCDGD